MFIFPAVTNLIIAQQFFWFISLFPLSYFLIFEMSKKNYVLSQGVDFDPQTFYIEYGFKTRQFAESELKKAVKQAYEETTDTKLKDFLLKEYISSDFKMLLESTYLDIYWTDTNSEVISRNTQKRKLDHLLVHQSAITRQRSEKDRRLSQTLTDHNILDLSNTGNSSQIHDVTEWNNGLIETDSGIQLPNLHPKTKEAIKAVTVKKITNHKRYTKSLSYQQQCPEDTLYIYKIISIVMNAHYTHASLFDLSVPQDNSEQDINNIIWAPIFDALFCNSIVKIKCGDTVLKDVNKNFKIDSRIGVVVNGRFVDISNIEVGKKVDTTKVKDDHQKIILEARTTIRRIIASYRFINPTSFNVFSFQVCQLKGDLLHTQLTQPSKYITKRSCTRIRIPLKPTDADAMELFLQTLMLFKEQVEETAVSIKDDIIKAIDRRGSFDPVLNCAFKKNLPQYASWIKE